MIRPATVVPIDTQLAMLAMLAVALPSATW